MSSRASSTRIVLAPSVTVVGEPLAGVAGAAARTSGREFERAAKQLRFGGVQAASRSLDAAALALQTLRACTGEVAARIAARPGLPVAAIEAVAPGTSALVPIYDAFFGMARTAWLSAAEAAVAAIPTLLGLARDLPHAPLPYDDAARLADLAADMLSVATPDGTGRMPECPRTGGAGGPVLPLERWRLGHALYGAANGMAARALARATAAVRAGADDQAADEVRTAARAVQALTAAMEWAAAVSAKSYGAVVRPAMAPPRLPFELSGAHNIDHRLYRVALDEFLGECGLPHRTLAVRAPALAAARDELLHVDLVDLERHIALAHRLVGAAPALDEAEHGSAVAALRGIYHARTRRYEALLRLGTAAA